MINKKGITFLCVLLLTLILACPGISARKEDNAFVRTDCGAVHLRSGPSSYFEALALIEPGTPLTVKQAFPQWVLVSLPDPNGSAMLEGYIFSAFIEYTSLFPALIDTGHEAYEAFIAAGGKNMRVDAGKYGWLVLRESPSKDADSLGYVLDGTMVSAADADDGWSYVTFDGRSGYIMTQYLSTSYAPADPPLYMNISE